MQKFPFWLASTFVLCAARIAMPQTATGANPSTGVRGPLQVRANQTRWNARSGRITLVGAVALSGVAPSGRPVTWRGEAAKVVGARSEFQITDNVTTEFADGNATVNRALSDGHIAGYAENQLLSALREHPGFGRYRLHYGGAGAGASTVGELLFDRAKRQLIIYETFVYPEAKIYNKDHRVYSNVSERTLTDAIIQSRATKSIKRLDNIVDFGAQLAK